MQRFLIIILSLAVWAGCGTTRWSDSSRTATEQLLISGAIDRSVSSLDFRALAGKTVFIDTTCLKGAIDAGATVDEITYIMALTMRESAGADDCWTHDVLAEWEDIIDGTVDCGCPK